MSSWYPRERALVCRYPRERALGSVSRGDTWVGYVSCGTPVFFETQRPRTPSRHGRTRSSQPRRRSRAQLSERHSAVPPRRVGRRTAAFGRQSCGTEGTRLLIQDLAAAARQVSAARPMRAGVLSSDRAPSPGWDRDARRKVLSRADGERSHVEVSLCDRSAIARRVGAPAQMRARASASPRRRRLQNALHGDELSTDGPRSRCKFTPMGIRDWRWLAISMRLGSADCQYASASTAYAQRP